MSFRLAGLATARLLAPLVSTRAAQAGISDCIRFLEALQGIGTGAELGSRELTAIFRSVASGDKSVVFDAGAHTGQFLNEALARTGAKCAMHAFEPGGAAFQELSKTFGNNRRVHLNRCALAAIAGTGRLFYDEPGSQLASLTHRPRFGANAQCEDVCLLTLDDYCETNAISRIDLLKLDVEGHELGVLQGAEQLLDRQAIKGIVFEFGGCNIDSRIFFRDIYEFLRSKGMKISRLSPGGALHQIDRYGEFLERFHTTNYLATL